METGLAVSSGVLWVVVLANLLLTLALVRRVNAGSQSAPQSGLKTGEPAPDFTAHTLEGELVSRSTYAGRKAAFVFISAHCGPCRTLVPQLVSLAAKAMQAGVEIILVSSDEQEETRAFAEEFNVNFPVLVAPRMTNTFLQDYKCAGTPSYCLVNEAGKVQSAGYPSIQGGEWEVLTGARTKQVASAI